jgi:hypothetical protein
LLSHINSSGFPLQIAIQKLVEKNTQTNGWKVLTYEHSWKSEKLGQSGFIDIVLENRAGTLLLVIECKRIKESGWIFLYPDQDMKNRRHIKSWTTFYSEARRKFWGWKNNPGSPETIESEFCVVAGQTDGQKPMLERIASELVLATECLAINDYNHLRANPELLRIFIPIIVTNAKLQVCPFNPTDVNLETGELKSNNLVDVPYLRFRKQLAHKEPALSKNNPTYKDISYEKENTVFIVNSLHLLEFLEELELDDI